MSMEGRFSYSNFLVRRDADIVALVGIERVVGKVQLDRPGKGLSNGRLQIMMAGLERNRRYELAQVY